nr:reverse transcriptase domain-containing protein [Tanacetum cinerariifolium]
MADQHSMAQLLQAPNEGYKDAIVFPAITADNFDLKHGLLTLVQNKQFFGHDKEDPHAHIRYFNKITSTLKFLNVLNSLIKLMLFPFSLEGAARIWQEKEPPRSIFTWDDLVSKFINQFFPPSKTTNIRNEITNFQQCFDESFSEAWDRFKDLLRAYQDSLNSAAGGNFLDKMPRECLAIIESKFKVRYSRNKLVVAKVSMNTSTSGISPDVDELKDMVKALLLDKKSQNQAPAIVKAVEESCVTCGGAHSYQNCPATGGNIYCDNIQEYISQASAVNYNQGNTSYRPSMMSNQIRPPGFPPKRISLPELTPTCMTLELADRLISRPIGVTKDVYVKVGKFHFSADFVVVDFDADPRVPLILERSFLKTERALIDVFEGELTLRVGKEAITFNLDQTSRYSANYNDNSINRIDVIEMAYEEYSQEVLEFFDVITSGNPTPYYDPIISTTSPTLTPFGNSDFLLEEVDAFLVLEDDPSLPEVDQTYVEYEGDIILLEAFLNDDPSLLPPNQGNYLPKVLKELKICEAKSDKSSIDEPLAVEIKYLPPHLEYAFLEGDDKLSVIIAKDLSMEEKTALITVLKSHKRAYLPKVFKELKICEAKSDKSSIDEPLAVEIKYLPPHLEYAFLEVIIAKDLSMEEKTALITVLKSHKRAIAWKLFDIKGINLEFCTHKILMEDDFEPAVQHQRRVNPKIYDVIKQEVLKLLDAGLIYPISDSPWVSPVHCVPKKGGFTVVENEENKLILTRLVTGWRVCINNRKLNEATRKDHFPLPFMDQMLKRLAGNQYYCFLDGFSGYFQIPIDLKDQEKTTFTCPDGTFAYRRMPFGLCNVPGTIQRCMMAIFYDMIEKTMEVFMDDFSVF